MEAGEPNLPDELVARAVAGDSDAFAAAIRTLDPGLRAFAARLVGVAGTDDVLQEAYLKAFRALPGFDPAAGSLRAWLFRIVYTTSIDAIRQGGRTVEARAGSDADGRADDEAIAVRLDLLRAFERLDLSQRAAVVLVDVIGFDYGSAACVLGVSRTELAARLRAGRDAVRDVLDPPMTQRRERK
jgi:RNA polymerase sigma-70 factor (ECF subfamily)